MTKANPMPTSNCILNLLQHLTVQQEVSNQHPSPVNKLKHELPMGIHQILEKLVNSFEKEYLMAKYQLKMSETDAVVKEIKEVRRIPTWRVMAPQLLVYKTSRSQIRKEQEQSQLTVISLALSHQPAIPSLRPLMNLLRKMKTDNSFNR